MTDSIHPFVPVPRRYLIKPEDARTTLEGISTTKAFLNGYLETAAMVQEAGRLRRTRSHQGPSTTSVCVTVDLGIHDTA